MPRKKCNWLDVIEDIEAIHPNIKVPIDQKYINNRTKIRYKCNIHGEQSARPYNLKLGKGCPKCGKKSMSQKQKCNWDDVIKAIEAKHPNITVYRNQKYINAHTKIRYKCNIHGEQTARPNQLKSGGGCWHCGFKKFSKAQKNVWLDVIKEIESINPNITVYRNQEYINGYTKISYKCNIHDEQTATPKSLKSGSGCPECSRIKVANSLKCNWLDVIKAIEAKHPNITVYRNQKYINAQTKIRYKCKDHGEQTATPNHLKNGRGCPGCSRIKVANSLKSNWLDVIKEIKSINPNITVYRNQEYINGHTKISYKCKDHGEQTATPNKLKSGRGCPGCANEFNANTKKCNWLDVIKAIESEHPNITVYRNQKYINAHTKIRYKCKDHGEQTARPHSLKQGHGCPECWNERQVPYWTNELWSEYCRKAKGKPILYWIKMTWENDSWYKFGMTYRGIQKRFIASEFNDINIEIIKIVSGEPEHIWDLEQHLHGFYGNRQYIPDDIEFGGDHECYKFKKPILDIEKELINLVNDFQKDNDCNFLVSDTE